MHAFAPPRLDAATVGAALRARGRCRDTATIRTLTTEPIGIGALADTFRLHLTWRDGEGPDTLVAKMPAADESAARTAASIGAYEREVRFYVDLAPASTVAVPELYGVLGEAGAEAGLLLADLSERYVPGEQLSDAPPELVRRLRRQLVALQAPFWNDASTGGLDWLHRRLGVPIPGIAARMRTSWATSRERLTGGFDPAEVDLIDRFVTCADAWAQSLDGPYSLTHHDFRLDNVMVARAADPADSTSSAEPPVVVLDWQTVGWGVPMFDVAYLLGTSMSPARRRELEREEIRRHVADLREAGVAWDEDDAWRRYRQASFAVLLMLVPPTGSVKQSARADAMFARLLRFGARMALDLDATEFLPDVPRDVLPDAVPDSI